MSCNGQSCSVWSTRVIITNTNADTRPLLNKAKAYIYVYTHTYIYIYIYIYTRHMYIVYTKHTVFVGSQG